MPCKGVKATHPVTNVTSPHQLPFIFFSWIDLIDADVVHSSM